MSLAAGSALLALGTDTAGSVRIPASMTGNAGLKTGVGRWSIAQIAPLSPKSRYGGRAGSHRGGPRRWLRCHRP